MYLQPQCTDMFSAITDLTYGRFRDVWSDNCWLRTEVWRPVGSTRLVNSQDSRHVQRVHFRGPWVAIRPA